MRTGKLTLVFAYLRLSNEEAHSGESASIANQRQIIQDHCRHHGGAEAGTALHLPAPDRSGHSHSPSGDAEL